MTKSDNKRQCV